MITTLNLAIIGLSILGWVAITAPEECPLKYMKTIEKGGVLNHNGEISNWCRTAPLSEYGAYYWVLKEEQD